jgi:hypothetical protein
MSAFLTPQNVVLIVDRGIIASVLSMSHRGLLSRYKGLPPCRISLVNPRDQLLATNREQCNGSFVNETNYNNSHFFI